MKNKKIYIGLIMLVLGVVMVFSGCKESTTEPNYNANKSDLAALIDSAGSFLSHIQEGNKPGEYAPGSKDTLSVTLSLAKKVNNKNNFTQQQVNNTISNLGRVISFVKGRLIQEVSVENLVAQWKFNRNAKDATGNGHDGTPESGWIGKNAANATPGNTLPKLTTDRFGRADMAYHFSDGAYIEIPYDRLLNPQSLTISLWLKVDATDAGNYILSLDRWNGFKFQLQTNNFLFLTINTSKGIHDVDDNPGSIPLNEWTQAAVSYTDGAEKFYINGDLVKTVEVEGTPITLENPVNLVIGNELPKDEYNFSDNSDPDYFWGANYFRGSLDDIRFYNAALSDADIYSIYTIEKSL